MNIRIVRAKPNPAGKDLAAHRPIPQQLLGEWLDVQNTGIDPINLTGLGLAHRAYQPNGQFTVKVYWNGAGVLEGGRTLRVHTGHNRDIGAAAAYDFSVGVQNAYAGHSSFVLNNNGFGDTISIWRKQGDGWALLDEAQYLGKPQEGRVLTRNGGLLV